MRIPWNLGFGIWDLSCHMILRRLIPVLCLLIAGFIGIELFAQPPPLSSPPQRTFRVVFWNIQWFPGGGPSATRRQEAKQIASVHRDIGKIDADVIGMEEVRNFARRGSRCSRCKISKSTFAQIFRHVPIRNLGNRLRLPVDYKRIVRGRNSGKPAGKFFHRAVSRLRRTTLRRNNCCSFTRCI